MLRIAETVVLADGWRRRLIACAAGAVGALAMAPVDFFPAMLIPMTVAVWLLDGSADAGMRRMASLVRAFGIGWWWGFGYFLAGLWWLGAAFLVEADKFAWALPLGVIGLPAVLAFFPAFGFMVARLLWSPGPGRILALATGLGLAEWLRGHMFTGFPWNSFGMALGDNLVLAQFASVVGLYGLTLLTIAIFAAPAVLIDRKGRSGFAGLIRGPLGWAGAALLCLALFGAIRLAPGSPPFVKGVNLRIMQPNLAQDAKFRPENGQAILTQYLNLSDRSTGPAHTGLADVSVLIWPESAFPFILSRTPEALAQIGAALSPNSVLVTGAARQEDVAGDQASNGRSHAVYFNAVQVVAKGGIILESYDKVHLVPFGEYLPFAGILTKLGLHHFVHIPGGFDAGTTHRLLTIPGLPPSAPLICYEAIFSGEIVPRSIPGDQPGLLLNLTNDAWFGNTAGPYQHFAQARLRTIEEGLPLVRAANTGISAIVDPYGRIIAELPLGREGVLDGALPQKLTETIYAHLPFILPFLVWLSAFIGSLVFRRQV